MLRTAFRRLMMVRVVAMMLSLRLAEAGCGDSDGDFGRLGRLKQRHDCRDLLRFGHGRRIQRDRELLGAQRLAGEEPAVEGPALLLDSVQLGRRLLTRERSRLCELRDAVLPGSHEPHVNAAGNVLGREHAAVPDQDRTAGARYGADDAGHAAIELDAVPGSGVLTER